MSSVNMAIVVGRIGSDPESETITSGQTYCNFSVATSEKWTDRDGQKQERTEWHRVTAWGKLAEICAEYLKKGSMVYVEGQIQTRSWEDGTGTKRYSTGINAKSVKFLGSKNSKTSDDNLPNFAPQTAAEAKDQEIPF